MRRSLPTIAPAQPQKNCGDYKIDLTLLAARVREIRPWLYKRFPFFDSEPFERRMMFGDRRVKPTPLTILPTARLAMAAQSGARFHRTGRRA